MEVINVRPILVNTNEINKIGDICLFSYGLNIAGIADIGYPKQELILISLEPNQKFEIGDKYFINGFIKTCVERNKYINDFYLTDHLGNEDYEIYCKKVIAKQDQIPESYIQQLIKEYNNSTVKDINIEMEEFDHDEEWSDIGGAYETFRYRPRLTNGFVTIVDDSALLQEDWMALLAIKNIPELPHVINSVRELRKYYIDGIQAGYEERKSEEPLLYTDEEVQSLLNQCNCLSTTKHDFDWRGWFNLNKKK